MQGIRRVDVVELDKLCRKAADDVRRLFEKLNVEKSIRVKPNSPVILEPIPLLIGPDGSVIVKLSDYDWASVEQNGLLLDSLTCSLYVVGDEVHLYDPSERALVIGTRIVWEGAERPYTAKEFVETVAQKLGGLLLKAAKRLGAQP